MTPMTIRPAQLPADLDALGALCWAYRDLLITRTTHVPDLVERYYSTSDYAALIADLPRIHARPMGDILVAELNGAILGCAMYYRHSSGPCEVKRIFVADSARGHGAGHKLLAQAKERAKADGHTLMVLDTVHTLVEAIALYERSGFTPAAPFYEPDQAYTETLRFYACPL
jgi:putative acetyltransferase